MLYQHTPENTRGKVFTFVWYFLRSVSAIHPGCGKHGGTRSRLTVVLSRIPCMTGFCRCGSYHAPMKADLRISFKDYRPNQTLHFVPAGTAPPATASAANVPRALTPGATRLRRVVRGVAPRTLRSGRRRRNRSSLVTCQSWRRDTASRPRDAGVTPKNRHVSPKLAH